MLLMAALKLDSLSWALATKLRQRDEMSRPCPRRRCTNFSYSCVALRRRPWERRGKAKGRGWVGKEEGKWHYENEKRIVLAPGRLVYQGVEPDPLD